MRTIMSEQDITAIITQDEWMMNVLRAADALNLPDWWIGAGFLRNKVWDYIDQNEFVSTSDVDLVYFDKSDTAPETDWAYDEKMKAEYPFAEWEIRNQARMHYINDFEPFTSAADGIAHWVETATCVAVKLENRELKYLFCHGTDDLYGLVARPIAYFDTEATIALFNERVQKKQWQKRWPNLQVVSATNGSK